MQREELCILTNMCMIYNDNQILVQDRKNPDWPAGTLYGDSQSLSGGFAGTHTEAFYAAGCAAPRQYPAPAEKICAAGRT